MNTLDLSIIAINMGPSDPMIKILDETLEIINGFFIPKKTVLLTDLDIKHPVHEIKKIPKLSNLYDLNLFCIKELYRYIDTDHYMIVQPDGRILNPEMWKDEWLNYDYIGAPWSSSVMKDKYGNPAIGNGGFCIRSKSLTDLVHKKYNPPPLEFNEDGYYSNRMNHEEYLQYPSVEEALHFSQETIINKNIKPFGIHAGPKCLSYVKSLYQKKWGDKK